MKIDLDHLHYWMCAIRESKDPIRTLDAFWKGQIQSKQWLIEKIFPIITQDFETRYVTVDIHGGWMGVLASMIFQSDILVSSIRSIDIDNECQSTAIMMNKKEEIEGRFTAVTANMCDIQSNADIVINTSCEHISQLEYESWLNGLLPSSLIVLQSNNYDIDEHIRIADDLDEFIRQSKLSKIFYAGELETQKYKRFMIIGKR
jgi:hypothetical protein